MGHWLLWECKFECHLRNSDIVYQIFEICHLVGACKDRKGLDLGLNLVEHHMRYKNGLTWCY